MAKVEIGKSKLKDYLIFIIVAIIGLLGGAGIDLAIRPTEEGVTLEVTTEIELSEEQVPTIIETDEGEIEIEAPTVEAVDTNQQIDEACAEDEECGQGWYVDTTSPEAFKSATYGQCIDTDGHYGSQCWDLGNLFWQNYAGRTLSTCGTGAAKGTLNCYEYNAGDEFEMIWDPTQLQAGDWIIFTNGTYGHIGMALGGYNNGYVALYGTNQGGASCSGGGSTSNVINISLKNFGGAFRPKAYIKEEPVSPEIPITGCLEWAVARGDTMTKIMYECEGFIAYGETMNTYAKSWYSRNVKPGQSVYDGWHSASGVGLYAGDWIDHEVGE